MAAPLGFKTFTTGEVLTAADTNGYLMQGIWTFANATARDAAVTSPQEGNTCYLKDTDVIQVYSGSAWVTKSGSSPLTTKGDLYTYSTTDARLPVGTNGQVLQADSTAATGLAWATATSGGMTLISTTTLSGASITLSSIPQTYKTLVLYIRNFQPATDGAILQMRFNGVTSANYVGNDLGVSLTTTFTATRVNVTLENDNAVAQGLSAVTLYDYTNTTTWKWGNMFTIGNDATTTTSARIGSYFIAHNNTAAITSITLLASSGNLTAGTVLLYGVS